MTEKLLAITNLTVDYTHDNKPISAVRDVNLELESGQTLGLVGESGCGKSTLALAIMGLLPKEESRISAGTIQFHGRNLIEMTPEERRILRGPNMAMVFQDPFSALNPVLTIQYQLFEVLDNPTMSEKRKQALELLSHVQLSDPERILSSYPHQLSGGQRQRVLIAMALAQKPELLIADEPTTALDVTIQDDIMKLLMNLQKELKMAMIFVTHNMGLVKGISNQLAVMYAGQIAEYGKTSDVLANPKHPYTQGLLKCIPKLQGTETPIPVLPGQPPEPHKYPTGCAFHPRCEKMLSPCAQKDPQPQKVDLQLTRCHLYGS